MLYKYLAPLLAAILIFRPRLLGRVLDKTGLPKLLTALTVLIFRRRAVAGANVFALDVYGQLNPDAPKGFWGALNFHLSRGEALGRAPTYFFSTFWFRQEYQHLIPKDCSPLVFFLLNQRRYNLKPHWSVVFNAADGSFFKILSQDQTGLKMGPRRQKLQEGLPGSRLSDIEQNPADEFGWTEIRLERTEPMPKANQGPSLLKFREVTAVGGETLLRTSDGFWLRADQKPAVNPFPGHAVNWEEPVAEDIARIWRLKQMHVLDKGLLLLGPNDWRHERFLVETLSRLPILPDQGFPLIINGNASPLNLPLLRLLARGAPLIQVNSHRAFKVEQAWYPSPAGLDQGRALPRLRKRVLEALVNELRSSVNPHPPEPPQVFISSGAHRLARGQDLEIWAVARGFEIIKNRPELIPWLTLINRAQHILMPAGEEVGSILFARKGGRVDILSDHPISNSLRNLWSSLAEGAGVDLHLIEGGLGNGGNRPLSPDLLQEHFRD